MHKNCRALLFTTNPVSWNVPEKRTNNSSSIATRWTTKFLRMPSCNAHWNTFSFGECICLVRHFMFADHIFERNKDKNKHSLVMNWWIDESINQSVLLKEILFDCTDYIMMTSLSNFYPDATWMAAQKNAREFIEENWYDLVGERPVPTYIFSSVWTKSVCILLPTTELNLCLCATERDRTARQWNEASLLEPFSPYIRVCYNFLLSTQNILLFAYCVVLFLSLSVWFRLTFADTFSIGSSVARIIVGLIVFRSS